MVLDTYGKSTGFCIDPIEKKPLFHFYPGTSVLSFGTAGCNLGCQFFQNWDISKAKQVERLTESASPETIANAAKELQCQSVAFTYNDPVIWAEYAIETAKACHEQGIKTVAVTAGYIEPEPREEFFSIMDAANVDLKAFTESFYHKITYSHLEPVLDTLRYIKHHTDVWLEITNLVIPNANDSPDELARMCDFLANELGDEVPIHFSAFHPDFRMQDRPRTPHEVLVRAWEIAKSAGLKYVYVGNVHDALRSSTYCANCGELLIERDWYQLGKYELKGAFCRFCGVKQSGRFSEQPGDWGPKRLPININRFRVPDRNSLNSRVSLAKEVVEVVQVQSDSTNANRELPILTSNEVTVSLPTLNKLPMLSCDSLTDEQCRLIHKVTQSVIVAAVLNKPLKVSASEMLGELASQHVHGVFTTLTRAGNLRGCCGFLGTPKPLSQAIVESAERTAKDDVRLAAISAQELPYLHLDVSILSAPIPLDCPSENRAQSIEIARHGLRLTLGNSRGLLLPSVAVEQNWNATEFLDAACRKAQLLDGTWKNAAAVVETFEAKCIEGAMEPDCLPEIIPPSRAPGSIKSLLRLKQVVVENIIAMNKGMTPNYVVLDAMDGTVNGIVLSIHNSDDKSVLASWIQTSIRPGIPLQASLFELSKSVAQTLSQARLPKDTSVDIELTILFDPIHHGILSSKDWNAKSILPTLEKCGLDEVSTKERALVTLVGNRVAVGFNGDSSVMDLLQEVASLSRLRTNTQAVFSMACVSTLSNLIVSNASQPDTRSDPRQAAMAKVFYPEGKEERIEMVQSFLKNAPARQKERALAIMSPHAGLRFSGQTAVDVWSSVEIPKSILVIGPKHTNAGPDWSIAPCSQWLLPNSEPFPADSSLVQAISERVEGVELDASAHAGEHAIEVLLPILEGLHPTERPSISAIVLRGATLSEIERFSEQLASVLAELPELPLLVISSDLNHYQPEAENRRRDELALEAMMVGNAEHLLETCRKNDISMCGVVPAAIVMKTLQCLNRPFRVDRIAYSNSASIGGDHSRTVGYGGVALLTT
jgi:AmmeMemoRadiSam system radical SAM enzyme/AmmeMemoRadiSam system protein B/AmmeMemoRadiSam system protein A